MSKTSHAQNDPIPLQATRERLEAEIQETVNKLHDSIVSEVSDLGTMKFRLLTEGAAADLSDIRHRPIEAIRRDLDELVRHYGVVCICLGVEPKKFLPAPTQELSTEEQTAPLRLV